MKTIQAFENILAIGFFAAISFYFLYKAGPNYSQEITTTLYLAGSIIFMSFIVIWSMPLYDDLHEENKEVKESKIKTSDKNERTYE